MKEAVRGYLDAVIDASGAPDRAAGLAAELRAVMELVRSSADLRYALADPGVPPASRRAVLTQLLEGRLPADVVRLVGFAVATGRAPELLADLEELVDAADAAASGLADSDALLGRSVTRDRLDGYVTAMVADAEAAGRSLSTIEEELYRFSQVVDESTDLSRALTDRDQPAAVRAGLVSDLLSRRADPATTRLAAYPARIGRARDYAENLAWLVQRVAAERGRRVADVRSAVALDEDQRRRLADALGAATGRPVEVRVTVDPDLIGGFVATVGDTLVDASVRHRLERMKDLITLPEMAVSTGSPGDQ